MRCRDCKTLRKSEMESGYCGIREGVLNSLYAIEFTSLALLLTLYAGLL